MKPRALGPRQSNWPTPKNSLNSKGTTMKNWYSICALNEGAEISIYDEIGAYGVSAKAFLADLGKLPDKAPLLEAPGEWVGLTGLSVRPKIGAVATGL